MLTKDEGYEGEEIDENEDHVEKKWWLLNIYEFISYFMHVYFITYEPNFSYVMNQFYEICMNNISYTPNS